VQSSQATCPTNPSSSGRTGSMLERSGSIQSLSQAAFNTSLSFDSVRGTSPPYVMSFTSETVPLAVAFCETVHAYFTGTSSTSRSAAHSLATHSLEAHSLKAHSVSTHSLAAHSLATHSLAAHSLAAHSLATHSLATHSLATHSLAAHSLEAH